MPSYDADGFKSALDAMHGGVRINEAASQTLWANSAFLEFSSVTEDNHCQLVDADHRDPLDAPPCVYRASYDLGNEHKSSVDLHAMLREICDGRSVSLAGSDVQIKDRLTVTHFQPQPKMLCQTTENLIANSTHCNAPDRVDEGMRVSRNQTGSCVAIDDNGFGISEDAGGRIFSGFTRFGRSSQGSGPGLTILKRSIGAPSGRIDVQSSDASAAIGVAVPTNSPTEERL
ncbi:MAG: ATP-binding protein [Pseudomonadota bacterium]